MVEIRLLGEIEVINQSDQIPLPPSKKTKGLLAYLALSVAPQRRERLCGMFWENVDDPRGSLRWSLSKLRAATRSQDDFIIVDRDSVSINPAAASIDILEMRKLIAKGLDQAPTQVLEHAVNSYGGSFLEGNDLPDCGEFQSWCVAERETARRGQIEIIQACLKRFEDAPQTALHYARLLTVADPDRAAGWQALLGLLLQLDRRSEAREQLEAAQRRLRDLPDQSLMLARAWREMLAKVMPLQGEDNHAAGALAKQSSVLRQNIQFCRTEDGVRIAYATTGKGRPLVKPANWMTHLEYDLESPVWRHWIRELSRDHQLIRYDERANGLSDWDVPDLGRETFVKDLAAVMDAAGVAKAPLLGVSQGCAVGVAYAVANPERVSHLVLYGGYARGWAVRGRPDDAARRQALGQLIEHGWGQDNPAFRQVFTTLFFPEASPEQMHAFNELQRMTISPHNAARLNEAFGYLTVEHLLPLVKVPTLVLHCRDDGVVPFDEGRLLASGIPGAKLVALEGRNHILLEHEPAWSRFLSEIRQFLADA
jgi:DNA-binding SARP family transcriptional activator/pimeloyl-ACP methyl ester carboxylesterase